MECEETSDMLLKKIYTRRKLEEDQQHIGWYIWLISTHPSLVIFLCAILTTVFTIAGVYFTNSPDFSDPSKGFEVRGSPLADKLVTWHKILNQTGYSLPLSNYPYVYLKNKVKESLISNKVSELTPKAKEIRRLPRSLAACQYQQNYSWNFTADGYFCGNPKTTYANWIFELVPGTGVSSLWSLGGLRAICQRERELMSHESYSNICIGQCTKGSVLTCCPVLSISNYVAYIGGVSDCAEITEQVLRKVDDILKRCAVFYCKKKIKSNCWESAKKSKNCPGVPKVCTEYNVAHSIFYFLFDHDFICQFHLNATLLRSTVFLSAYKHRNLLPLYYDNFAKDENNDIVRIFGLDFGIADEVFADLLFTDTKYPILAMSVVALIILCYTHSSFITVMSFLSTISSILIAYFLYTVVLDFTFFPFLNLTAVLVMVGLSADSVMIFNSSWRTCMADDKQKVIVQLKTERYPLLQRTIEEDSLLKHSKCFIEMFKLWMENRDCSIDPLCCEKKKFPYHPSVFEDCLKEALYKINVAPDVHLDKATAGPRYDDKDVIRAIIVEFDSNLTYSSSQSEVKRFYEGVERFFSPLLQSAPTGLANGWFISDLEFFALQEGLYSGAIASVCWSLAAALVIVFLSTRNLLVSVLSIVTIAGIIFVTVAALVLMGWELNVLESLTVSIAIGLSVDFTLHYAIAYLVAKPTHDRVRRVESAISQVGPPITLAALTTFIGGVGMLPSNILAYFRFGIFLMVLMAVSWTYSSYFFLALLSIVGPQGRTCEFHCKRLPKTAKEKCRSSIVSPKPNDRVEFIERATVL